MKRYTITFTQDNKRMYIERETKKSALKVAYENYMYNPTVLDSKKGRVYTNQDEFENSK